MVAAGAATKHDGMAGLVQARRDGLVIVKGVGAAELNDRRAAIVEALGRTPGVISATTSFGSRLDLMVCFSSPITTIGGVSPLSATRSQPPISPLTVKPSLSRKCLTGR